MAYNPEIDWSKNTGMMLGRFQPWNAGHRAMFEQISSLPNSNHRDPKKTTPRQVVIMVRHQGDGKYTFDEIKQQIIDDLEPDYHGQYTVMLVPNITNVFMGRQVGFDIERIDLTSDMEPVDNKLVTSAERQHWDRSFWKDRQ